ncbi:MAG TPA: hypothetical protein VN781_01195 [Acidimicrobiales bacterium]|nr:hypothetical protein [Acidimicrobiales bacterium]
MAWDFPRKPEFEAVAIGDAPTRPAGGGVRADDAVERASAEH